MKIIIKIYKGTEANIQKGKYFVVAKDKQGNFYMFYSDVKLNDNDYYMMNILEYDFVISKVATIDVRKYELNKLNVLNGVLSLNGTPVKGEELIINKVQVSKLIQINRRLEYVQNRYRKAS